MAIAKLADRISSKAGSSAKASKAERVPALYELKQGFTASHVLDPNSASSATARATKGMSMAERLAAEEAAEAQAKADRWRRDRPQQSTSKFIRGEARGRGGMAGSGRTGRGMESVMGRERAGRGGFGGGGFRGRGGRGGGGRGGGGRGGGRGRGR